MIVTNLLTLHNQLKIHHWQTKSYAEHQALGGAYDEFSDLIDGFIVCISVIDLIIGFIITKESKIELTSFRAVRILRIFKLVRSWTSFRILLAQFLDSLKDILNFVILMSIFMIIFMVLGM